MINVKHLMDAIDAEDGLRIWVEPIGLVRELREWCSVDRVLTAIAPPPRLWNWFETRPDEYEQFRGRYHDHLERGPLRIDLHLLALAAGGSRNVTLLHAGDDPTQNTATALAEFLVELSASPIG